MLPCRDVFFDVGRDGDFREWCVCVYMYTYMYVCVPEDTSVCLSLEPVAVAMLAAQAMGLVPSSLFSLLLFFFLSHAIISSCCWHGVGLLVGAHAADRKKAREDFAKQNMDLRKAQRGGVRIGGVSKESAPPGSEGVGEKQIEQSKEHVDSLKVWGGPLGCSPCSQFLAPPFFCVEKGGAEGLCIVCPCLSVYVPVIMLLLFRKEEESHSAVVGAFHLLPSSS